jgi:DNA end-binding protein Ku
VLEGMPRSMWKGAITFGLVTVPVSLYSATERQAEIHFRLLHKKDASPIDYRRYCSAEDVQVDWNDIVKGYEYEKGRFVVMTDADFEKARTPATQTIDIQDFVPACDIDFAHFDAPYWLEPDRAGRKGYALLREALSESQRVGIGTLVLRQREHLVAVRPAGNALMLTTMRFENEIRSAEGLDIPTDVKIDPREKKLAAQLVDTLAGPWQPDKYRDTYTESLQKAIEQKLEGKEIQAAAPGKPPKVVDLMEALQASLKEGRRPPAKVNGRRAEEKPAAEARGRRAKRKAS